MDEPAPTQSVNAIGLVVIHGVTPQARYDIQDFAASNLRVALEGDEYWKTRGRWTSRVINLADPEVAKTLTPDPTVSRVQIGEGDPPPDAPYFDVIESYWSPLDKGKAEFGSVVSWLLRTVFVPLNTSARYASPRGKTVYDFTLVLGGIAIVAAFLLASLYFTFRAWDRLVLAATGCLPTDCPNAWTILAQPTQLGHVFSWWTLSILAGATIGAFLIAQAIKAALSAFGQRAQLARHEAQRLDRCAAIVVVGVLGALLVLGAAFLPVSENGGAGGWVAVWFVIAALCFVAGRTVAQSWIVNFFGDVQVYTTRNENSEFYAIREQILARVLGTVAGACSDSANGGRGYDRVYVLAHSLGSTISMDALIRYFELCEQAAGLKPAFQKLRGFITFGTSLEKTKYFFDVANPSPSLAVEQWNGDLYGALFTPDVTELRKANGAAKGIFWANYWYFKDAVSNRIDSYRSFVPPGTPVSEACERRAAVFAKAKDEGGGYIVPAVVAHDERGSKGFVFPEIIPHGEYLRDPWFWATDGDHLGVLDVVAGHCAGAPQRDFYAAKPFDGSARFERVNARTAGAYPDRYVVP